MNQRVLSVLSVLTTLFMGHTSGNKNVFYVHWNRANPMFRPDNMDHIVEVNKGNQRWEYDQVNLICPISKPGNSRYPETHVIYSVSKEEYETCRITNPNPRIVAVCNSPYRLLYFTLTFRSFTPIPGGLEFKPGQNYYFISTSSASDLHRRMGGGCATHNMRMIFKVAGEDGNSFPQDNFVSRKSPMFGSFENNHHNNYFAQKKKNELASRPTQFLYSPKFQSQEILSNHIEEAQRLLSNSSDTLALSPLAFILFISLYWLQY